MRKVPLFMITSEMSLAQPIYHYSRLLLAKGTRELSRYIGSLQKLGIRYIYIEDKLSEDIEVPDVISEKTRLKCKKVLSSTLDRLRTEGNLEEGFLTEVIDHLLEEIFTRPDILLSLNDIGTTDDSTLVHSVNTTVYALLLGRKLKYGKSKMKRLAEGALLHDIGKVLLDQRILYKPEKLSRDEFEHIKQHPALGYEILKKNSVISQLSRMVCLHHHERLDGSGYPFGIAGDKIHEFARIVAIADVYDAITSERCYQKGFPVCDAVSILMQESSNKLDASLTGLFIQNLAIYPNGTVVRLSDGCYAIVKKQNISTPFRPVVKVFDPLEQIPLYEIDLMKDLQMTITVPEVNFI